MVRLKVPGWPHGTRTRAARTHAPLPLARRSLPLLPTSRAPRSEPPTGNPSRPIVPSEHAPSTSMGAPSGTHSQRNDRRIRGSSLENRLHLPERRARPPGTSFSFRTHRSRREHRALASLTPSRAILREAACRRGCHGSPRWDESQRRRLLQAVGHDRQRATCSARCTRTKGRRVDRCFRAIRPRRASWHDVKGLQRPAEQSALHPASSRKQPATRGYPARQPRCRRGGSLRSAHARSDARRRGR